MFTTIYTTSLPQHPQWLITSHHITPNQYRFTRAGSYHSKQNKLEKKLSLFVFRYTLFVGLSLLFTGDSLSISDIRDI